MASETKYKEDRTRLTPEKMNTNVNSKPWPVVEVQKVCDLIVDCVNKTAPTVDHITPYKMIRTTNIRSGKADLTVCRYVEADTYEKWTRRAKVKAGDVLLTREAPLGEVGYISLDDTVFLGQRIMQYRANPKVLDYRYLHYVFLSPALRYQFGVHEGSGSVVSHIRVGDCYKFKIPLPPLKEQTVIANILGTLDDKIDLNNQMNSTLEQIAQTLFKRWFIDFEFPDENENPYKSSGGRMVDSELGEIPEGWEVKKLEDIAAINEGSIKKDYLYEEILYVDISSVDKGKLLETTKYDIEKAPSRARRIVKNGDIIWSMVRPNRRSFLLILDPQKNLVVSTGFAVISPKVVPYPYLYLWLTTDSFVSYLSLSADGSAYPAVTAERFKEAKVLVPKQTILKEFDKITSSLLIKKDLNSKESLNLSKIRDFLLPKLMSGKIRVEC
ncbi:hypothetical protein EO98_16010 [Methanosarcina sp. 2.H.T.1A.6]|uniref:restriction endonuclease subunit S n=1 Tax=unclassified Methanosarcina TaxID=2644672 RepID=UPI00062220DE|nr:MULTISPECIES: restriction endonuclease subunit S [unclassified Methanosarcina]KKG11767.1 hypothetical protein EO97_11510 [Methanosarcina sp. 2.H.T.1A.15]KKG17661.1 hypothetical protein EO94_12435 [Methanosarcina sp. 2.H.T.1A.3]KKG21901.1 hypothetical protein EO98_16010 [Methanosarcina sp. 2.H.T.1A.6]KKG25437.1 hypothetical protein EO96_00460 [Methanosarcina sp. 2.H.T.1A.8]